jgi:hypothetical protein
MPCDGDASRHKGDPPWIGAVWGAACCVGATAGQIDCAAGATPPHRQRPENVADRGFRGGPHVADNAVTGSGCRLAPGGSTHRRLLEEASDDARLRLDALVPLPGGWPYDRAPPPRNATRTRPALCSVVSATPPTECDCRRARDAQDHRSGGRRRRRTVRDPAEATRPSHLGCQRPTRCPGSGPAPKRRRALRSGGRRDPRASLAHMMPSFRSEAWAPPALRPIPSQVRSRPERMP